jgi:phospholipid-binding lipoprotein MlaA
MASRPFQLRRVIAPAAAAAAVLSIALAAGVAVAQESASPAARPNDPFERLNRGLYAVHRGIDKVILRPVARIYLAIAPKPLRQGLHNVLANLGEPITVVNDLLQLRIGKAASATTRFLANSTVGVLGLVDVAGKSGIPYHSADFGQTLGRYGLPAGPYLFIPVLGPSSLRDLGGRMVDTTVDPVRQVRFDGDDTLRTGRPVLGALDTRAAFDKDLEELDRTATDPYVTLRSAYLQNRQSFVSGGQVDVQSLPSFGPEPAPSGVSRPRSEADPVEDQQVAVVSDSFFRSIR